MKTQSVKNNNPFLPLQATEVNGLSCPAQSHTSSLSDPMNRTLVVSTSRVATRVLVSLATLLAKLSRNAGGVSLRSWCMEEPSCLIHNASHGGFAAARAAHQENLWIIMSKLVKLDHSRAEAGAHLLVRHDARAGMRGDGCESTAVPFRLQRSALHGDRLFSSATAH